MCSNIGLAARVAELLLSLGVEVVVKDCLSLSATVIDKQVGAMICILFFPACFETVAFPGAGNTPMSGKIAEHIYHFGHIKGAVLSAFLLEDTCRSSSVFKSIESLSLLHSC